jgi:hypothetical protein
VILSSSTIRAMCEGKRRVRRRPQCEWLAPIIERLEMLRPGDWLTIEVIALDRKGSDLPPRSGRSMG